MTPREVIRELLGEYPSMSDLDDVADLFMERITKNGFMIVPRDEWEAVKAEADRIVSGYEKLSTLVHNVKSMVGETKS
jgi:hypothetical protein